MLATRQTRRPAIWASMCWSHASPGSFRARPVHAADRAAYTDSRVQPLAAHGYRSDASGCATSILEALPAERIDLLRDFVREHVMRVLRRDEPTSRRAATIA